MCFDGEKCEHRLPLRLAMGTPFTRKQLQEVSGNDCPIVLCCPQVLLFSNIQIFSQPALSCIFQVLWLCSKKGLCNHTDYFFLTFHVVKVLLEKWACLKWLRKMPGSLSLCLSVVKVWHPAARKTAAQRFSCQRWLDSYISWT